MYVCMKYKYMYTYHINMWYIYIYIYLFIWYDLQSWKRKQYCYHQIIITDLLGRIGPKITCHFRLWQFPDRVSPWRSGFWLKPMEKSGLKLNVYPRLPPEKNLKTKSSNFTSVCLPMKWCNVQMWFIWLGDSLNDRSIWKHISQLGSSHHFLEMSLKGI